MSVDRIVLAVAGSFILISVVLSQVHHVYWLFLTAFVGLNLLQYGFSKFCPMALILRKIGVSENR